MDAMRKDGVLCPQACEPFLSLDDAAFKRVAGDAIERLGASISGDEAARIYRDEVLPLEMERIRREAVGRDPLDLLFVTVGAQTNSPILAAIASPAHFVVLLHTDKEKNPAVDTIHTLRLCPVEGKLTSIGDGKGPGELYRVVFDEWKQRGRPKNVGLDITGGLKIMSAAASAAAFSLPDGHTYYIDADRPSHHGREWWVRERRIELANPFQVFGEIRRATGRELLQKRQYAAAAAVYGELIDEEDRSRTALAKGYDALDRLDFATAAVLLEELCKRLDIFSHDPRGKLDGVVTLRAAIRANVEGAQRLDHLLTISGKDDPGRNLNALRSSECLDFGEMLLARAECEHTAPDVAALLAYRCLELIPQRRLALRGNTDPSSVDWDQLAKQCERSVEDLIAQYNNADNLQKLDPKNLPSEISSVVAFRLLAVAFPDDVAKVKDLSTVAGVGTSRNRSLLAHGLEKLSDKAGNNIRTKARQLFNALLEIEHVSHDDRAALKQRHTFVEVE